MDCTIPLGLALTGSSSVAGSDKSDNNMFKCRLPDGKVIFAESAEYDESATWLCSAGLFTTGSTSAYAGNGSVLCIR